MLDKDYKIPERGKPSIFVGERQSSALGLLKKSSISGVINESLRKLRGLVTQAISGEDDFVIATGSSDVEEVQIKIWTPIKVINFATAF